MKRSSVLCLLGLAVLLLRPPAFALAGVGVWTTNGPEGASITVLAVDPRDAGRVLAATPRAGIFESTDSGQTWRFLGLTGQSISAIVFDPFDPSKILVTAGIFLWRSHDRGRTWVNDSQGLPAARPPGYPYPSQALSAAAFDPSRQGVAYVGWSVDTRGPYASIVTDGGLLRTADGGATWTPTNLAGAGVASIAVDPEISSILYAVVFRSAAYYTPGSVVRSMDGGATWNDVLSGSLFAPDYPALIVDPHGGGRLFASTRVIPSGTGPSYLQSVDRGITWTAFAPSLDGMGPGGLVIDPTAPDVFYANTSAGLARSRDGGSTWTSVFGSSLVSLAIAPSDGRRLYGGLESGVTRSLDSGATWQTSHSGLVATSIGLLSADPGSPSHLWAVDEQGTLLERRDAASAWTVLSRFAGVPRSLTPDPRSSSALWAGDPACAGLSRSTDGGRTFGATSLGTGCIGPLAFEPDNPLVAYAPNSFASLSTGVFKSVDGGVSWVFADGGLRRDALVVAIDSLRPQTLYQGRVYEGVWKSTDGGATWAASSDGLLVDGSGAIRVQAILVDPNASSNLYAGLGTGGVFKSTDAGAHWSAANAGLGLGSVYALVADPTDSKRLYAGTDGGVFVTRDGGGAWVPVNEGLTNLSIRGLAIDPFGRLLHAATLGGGVFDIELLPDRAPTKPIGARHTTLPIAPR